jgi:N-acetylglucosamine kinase-like BadF-type ATPase
MGFNPFFHSETVIANAIRYHEDLHSIAPEISQVFFYGAGCSSKELNDIVERALKTVFRNASIEVDHDLMACAYATFEGRPAITCILGTGSNSIYIDDEQAYEEVPALAYILGDEGSGSYYGKQLLSAFLYKKLPDHLRRDFIARYDIDKNTIFENVYWKPHANVYLASFMKFISDHREDKYFHEMVLKGMKDFMETHVCCYPQHKECIVHFIGSIGHFFEKELRLAAAELEINVGKIVRKPIEGLVDYHIRQGHLEAVAGAGS